MENGVCTSWIPTVKHYFCSVKKHGQFQKGLHGVNHLTTKTTLLENSQFATPEKERPLRPQKRKGTFVFQPIDIHRLYKGLWLIVSGRKTQKIKFSGFFSTPRCQGWGCKQELQSHLPLHHVTDKPYHSQHPIYVQWPPWGVRNRYWWWSYLMEERGGFSCDFY